MLLYCAISPANEMSELVDMLNPCLEEVVVTLAPSTDERHLSEVVVSSGYRDAAWERGLEEEGVIWF
jgi:hypothetical protein